MDMLVNVLAVFLLILLVLVKILWHKVSELKKINQEANRIHAQAREVLRDVLENADIDFLRQARDRVKNMIADACLKDQDVVPMRTVAQYLDEIIRFKQSGESCENSSRLSGRVHLDDVME